MIEILPGTEGWDAWINHHRGTRTELLMALCRHDARPFYAWTEFPPDAPIVVGLSGGVRPELNLERQRFIPAEGEIERVAERLEIRGAREEAEQAADAAHSKKTAREASAFERAADAVRSGLTPSLERLPDVGLEFIDDPSELAEYVRCRKPPPKRAKLVNLRDDPIGQMAKRGQIEHEQLSAARKWQAVFDTAASIGGSRGIDPSAMKVDGGHIASEPINDVQMWAIKELEDLDLVLGRVGAVLVRRILGDRMTVAQVADSLGKPCRTDRERQTERERVGWRLRECLDTLVTVMSVKVKGARRRPPTDHAAAVAQYAGNPPLYAAVNEARRKIV